MPKLDAYLRQMLERKGSDLHLICGLKPRARVHGALEELEGPVLTPQVVTDLLHEICPEERWQQFQANRDLDFAYEIKGLARFRCNYLDNHYGVAAVFRQIPSKILSFDDLKLPEVLKRVCEFKQGLVLVTGPTGSGKSTTMAAMLDYINKHHIKHIVTIEDPVEFVHKNQKSIIVHREVGEHSRSFAKALRGAMRADPDVILVGEMRELETIKLALNCAAMGMLVFGTLHTNNAPKTIDRVIDVFPADQQPQIRTMLAECLYGVVSQLLCRKADGKGRLAVHEILLRTESLPNVIREGQVSNLRSLIQGSQAMGMVLMDTNIKRALERGDITPMEAYMKASEKKEFLQYLPEDAVLE
jgi:twitching motility protein PilT